MIPTCVGDLTPEWCTEALGREITAVDAAPIGVGVGLVGQLFRLHLSSPAGDRTVIAKLAAAGEESRFVATILNMYGREHGFYTEIAERAAVSAPDCYYCAHDPETQDTVLLLEDVSARGTAFDQISGCSVADAEPALRALARFHAGFWDDASLDAHAWLLKLCDDPYPGAVSMAYSGGWARMPEFYPDLMTPEVRRFGDAYNDRIPALFAKLCEGPLVMSHADWRLDNLFFAPDGDVIAIDWQLIDRSVGVRDVSYLVTQSVNLANASECRGALEIYLDALGEHGVDADRGWARAMYRYATAFGFVYPVVAAGSLTVEDPRHLELCRMLLERCIAAIAALDAWDLPL
ncbi:MAG TPA: hypothetical protein VFX21_03815 [Acidimicrobiia bacterium]|nr:hypothetical protein [Acidimicrobiia bacterium]